MIGDVMDFNKSSIEKLRKQKEITQEELAIKLDVTKDYISMIERGARTPSFKLAKKIADYFNTTVDDIFFDN